MAVELTIREVTVERVNGSGFNSDEQWWNISKFAKPGDVGMPSVGDRVLVSVDKSGFVRRIETPTAPATPAPASVTPEAPGAPLTASTIAQDDRGIVITRLAVLNTAVAVLSSGGRPTSADEVLALAGRLEAWAVR
jgi:hypothetical protein